MMYGTGYLRILLQQTLLPLLLKVQNSLSAHFLVQDLIIHIVHFFLFFVVGGCKCFL